MHTDAIHHLSYVRAEVEGDGFIGVRCEADTTYALRWCVEFCYSIALGDDVSEFRKQVIGCAYEFTVVDVKRDYKVVSGVSWAAFDERVGVGWAGVIACGFEGGDEILVIDVVALLKAVHGSNYFC